MDERNSEVAGDTPQSASPSPTPQRSVTRRGFLLATGLGSAGVLGLFMPRVLQMQAVASAQGTGTQTPVPTKEAIKVFVENATGMVIGDPSRCTGCRRCEIACSEFNDGKAQPSISRLKVGRNINFGAAGAQAGFSKGQGQFGNFLTIQDTCRQCRHPVPCALACPNQAIEVIPPVNARVVNQAKCTGCRTCLGACPWAMTSFDYEKNKSTKCTLCGGNPECVKACPTGALRYVPWKDRGKDVPARWVVPAYISTPAEVQASCVQCHK